MANNINDALVGAPPNPSATNKFLTEGALPASGAAPANATYVVLSANATLTAERVLAVNAPIHMVDSGAGAAVTLSHDAAGTAGTKGSASAVPVFVTDATGHVSSNVDTAILITESQVTNLVTDLAAKMSQPQVMSRIWFGGA